MVGGEEGGGRGAVGGLKELEGLIGIKGGRGVVREGGERGYPARVRNRKLDSTTLAGSAKDRALGLARGGGLPQWTLGERG